MARPSALLALTVQLALAALLSAGGAPAQEPGAAGAVIVEERVTLRLPDGEGRDAAHRRLAAELDAAVAAMRPRVPARLDRPLTAALERDYPAQIRSTGRIGEAVRGGPADLHLLAHPDDAFARRVALADLLIDRAGVAPPLWLRRGAALWLAGDWYGRPYAAWLPDFAAVDAFPAAADLLAAEEQPDASAVLWTPVAAAVVDRLPGATVAAKLARPPTERQVAELLRSIAADARARAGASPPPARPWGPAQGFLRGVSFAMLNSVDGGYHAPSVDRELVRLRALGADAVSIMPFAYQRDPRAPGLRFLNRAPRSETDAGAIHAARRAHAHGFRVLWKPHLWIAHDSWPGDVEMASEEAWRAWWTGYRRYVLHHAVLAAWSRSELFSVGVELSRTLGREAEWRRLIADVRRLYPGPVTYASNWYGGLDRVPFWDALDLLGVDAYYPLAASPDASPAELAAGARRVVAELERISRQEGKPLLLTEFGFAARRGAWVEPHREGGELSPADQAAAYRAFLTALGRPPWLAGAFVWKSFSDERGDRGDRPDFAFLGRPAEAAIRSWLTARDP